MNRIDVAPERPASPVGAELAIVLPTYNERDNIPVVVERIRAALAGVDWEIIVVDDDSPDGTAAVAREVGRTEPRVRCIRRVGRRGLAGACVEGMLATRAPYVAVMDADLQHDEAVLDDMLKLLRRGEHDVAVGSRYLADGSAEGLSRARLASSRMAGLLARRLLGVSITDPMSGLFMLRREVVEDLAPRLATQGFKILADILVLGRRRLRVAELPYRFRARLHGASKLDSRVALDFLGLIAARATGDVVPVRFVGFLLVGATGVLVHLAVLRAGLMLLHLGFETAQVLATAVAMTTNFLLNNGLTYRDQRLKGLGLLRGLALFYAICSVGALSNIGVAVWLYGREPVWWLAGLLGSLVGSVWNYALSSALVWRRRPG